MIEGKSSNSDTSSGDLGTSLISKDFPSLDVLATGREVKGIPPNGMQMEKNKCTGVIILPYSVQNKKKKTLPRVLL